jgi:hypothetical protein
LVSDNGDEKSATVRDVTLFYPTTQRNIPVALNLQLELYADRGKVSQLTGACVHTPTLYFVTWAYECHKSAYFSQVLNNCVHDWGGLFPFEI